MSSKLMSKLEGLMPGLDNTDAAAGSEAQLLARWEAAYHNDTALTTTTALTERFVLRAKRKSRITGIWLVSTSAVTGTASNFFTVLLDKRPATDYTTPTNVVTFAADTVTTDNLVAFTPKDIGPASSYAVADLTVFNLLRGDVLTLEITKDGTGMTFPVASVMFQLEPRD